MPATARKFVTNRGTEPEELSACTGLRRTPYVGVVKHRVAAVLDADLWMGTGGEVVDTMLWWQDRCWRGIRAEATAGDPVM